VVLSLTLHSFYTVLGFTCSCTPRYSSTCVDASVAGALAGWVNRLPRVQRSPEPLRLRDRRDPEEWDDVLPCAGSRQAFCAFDRSPTRRSQGPESPAAHRLLGRRCSCSRPAPASRAAGGLHLGIECAAGTGSRRCGPPAASERRRGFHGCRWSAAPPERSTESIASPNSRRSRSMRASECHQVQTRIRRDGYWRKPRKPAWSPIH
jgi:hypothetical protein